MKTAFETFAPPGDTEIVVVPEGVEIVSARVKVAAVCIIHGIECQTFERVTHPQEPTICRSSISIAATRRTAPGSFTFFSHALRKP